MPSLLINMELFKCEIGSTTYIGMLPSGYSEGELTVTLTEVGSAYGSTKKLVVDILSDDILTINEGSRFLLLYQRRNNWKALC